jgi:flagellar motor switch protein FliG
MAHTLPANHLKGPQKAAVLMLTLGEERASRLIGRLEDDEVRVLSRAMTGLDRLASDVVERVLDEVSARFGGSQDADIRRPAAHRQPPAASHVTAQYRSATSAAGAPAGPAPARDAAPSDVWSRLDRVDPAAIAAYLGQEHPQTAAVVLGRMTSTRVAGVLAQIDPEQAADIMSRMLDRPTVGTAVLEELEATLQRELLDTAAAPATADQGDARHVAAILEKLDPRIEARVLAAVETTDRTSARQLRSLAYRFDDLADLDARDLALVVRTVDTDRLAIALRGADASLRDKVLGALPSPQRDVVRQVTDTLVRLRLRDIEAAQTDVVAAAKTLASKGAIVLPVKGTTVRATS